MTSIPGSLMARLTFLSLRSMVRRGSLVALARPPGPSPGFIRALATTTTLTCLTVTARPTLGCPPHTAVTRLPVRHRSAEAVYATWVYPTLIVARGLAWAARTASWRRAARPSLRKMWVRCTFTSIAINNYGAIVITAPLVAAVSAAAPLVQLDRRPSGTLDVFDRLDGGESTSRSARSMRWVPHPRRCRHAPAADFHRPPPGTAFVTVEVPIDPLRRTNRFPPRGRRLSVVGAHAEGPVRTAPVPEPGNRVIHTGARRSQAAARGPGGRPADSRRRAALEPVLHGVDTRTVDGDLLKPGPAACWFNLERALVPDETNSPLVHTVSAADLCSGISAVVNLREVTFVNADLTIVFWRQPRAPWILLSAETQVGDQGTGVARGTLSDVDGTFGACEQTLIFERRA